MFRNKGKREAEVQTCAFYALVAVLSLGYPVCILVSLRIANSPYEQRGKGWFHS